MTGIHADPPPPIVTEPTGINYATGPALGKGGFAICHRAERYEGSKPTGQIVALKIVRTKMEPAKLCQKFVSELQIHSKLSHPNIVAFYRAFAFQTSTYVVLELCPNGSLADMLKKRKHLTLPEIRRYVIQICGAVKYLHHRHIVHRDLKTGNLFLDDNMNVKVGDFGLAALLVTEKEMEVKRRTTMCGTPNYLAPEILEKGKGHDEKVDLWAIGVIAYTLAVGKAPFHASTKEEIYKKLRSGTYTWPELSQTNNQSADLRHLVSSLLVEEALRPIPDQIVSQNFFKIAFVPSSIPTSAKEKAPNWPQITIPSPDAIRRGYSDTWFAICKESGVGEYEEGRAFKLNGGKRVRSIVYDIEIEAQAGKAPSMPIPADVVYLSTVSDWNAPGSNGPSLVELTTIPEDSQASSRVFKEVAYNAVSNPAPMRTGASSRTTDSERMPPPTRPSRSGTVRKAARTISEEAAKADHGVKVAADDPAQFRLPKVRQAGPVTLKRSADASLARRPRANTKPTAPGPLATLDELKEVSPFKPRRRIPEPEVVEILSDPKPEPAAQSRPRDVADFAPSLTLPAPPRMTSKKLPVPRKASGSSHTSDPNAVPGTDPAAVLQKLSVFRDNLATALSDAAKSRSTSAASIDADSINLPFITRWVDYSRKHGVGYVMSDGTVGCVINAASRRSAPHPVTHVLARNGQKWLAKIGTDYQKTESVPLEIFEDCGKEGIKRKVYKGLGSVKEGPLKEEAERRRVISLLWVKFGRYMCQSLEGEELDASSKSDNYVRFYQRIGSVGIWVFVDGCIQLHFPDHTKLVLSPTGSHISATCISPEAASYLATNADLLPHHVNSREVFRDSIASLLHDGGRVRARIVKANAIREKLDFVGRVVGEWLKEGGLGRLGEGFEAREGWRGQGWREGGQKGVVSAGRSGGDVVEEG